MTTPTLPLAGGCQCGRHRYSLAAAPRSLYACHCTACQRQSGSAFGLSMPVDRAALNWDGPEPAVWSRQAAAGGAWARCSAPAAARAWPTCPNATDRS